MYDIDLSEPRYKRFLFAIMTIAGLIAFIGMTSSFLPDFHHKAATSDVVAFFTFAPVSFGIFICGLLLFIYNHKKYRTLSILNKRGKLIKNLPYRIEQSGYRDDYGNDMPMIVVDCVMAKGNKVTLHSAPRRDLKVRDHDGRVDLVIDPKDPNTFYLDFEINRLSGNRKSDYYREPGFAYTD